MPVIVSVEEDPLTAFLVAFTVSVATPGVVGVTVTDVGLRLALVRGGVLPPRLRLTVPLKLLSDAIVTCSLTVLPRGTLIFAAATEKSPVVAGLTVNVALWLVLL